MAYCNCYKYFIILFFSSFLLFQVISVPIPNTPYDQFIYFLSNNNCSMPKEVKLPFENPSDSSQFNYLYKPLKECRTYNTSEEYGEANMLCAEIFDVLKNITCAKYDKPLSEIQSNLSENVCHEFQGLKDVLPRKDEYLSARLSDKIICKLLCSVEKYELCKTLLWSYDTLLKIKQVPSSEVTAQEKRIEGINEDSSNMVATPLGSRSNNSPIATKSEEQKAPEESNISNDNIHTGTGVTESDSNVKESKAESHIPKISHDVGEIASQNVATKIDPISSSLQDKASNKTTTSTKKVTTVLQTKSSPENTNVSLAVTENSARPEESMNLTRTNFNTHHMDDDENEIVVEEKLPKKDSNLQISSTKNSLTSASNKINDKNVTSGTLANNANIKGNINSNTGSKTNEKSGQHTVQDTASDNELQNGTFSDEVKPKTKQTDMENQVEKEILKAKQTDYESMNEIIPYNDSKLAESSTQLPLPEEDIEHPEDNQYNEIENDGDYAKPEYDNSFGLLKNKESEVKNSFALDSSQMTNGYDGNINTRRNNIGQISEEIAVIAPFPEQEDSHFFFYFLSIVVIIMAGYLVFHNKQKIIALIVEGRHERRRRSYAAGYKKLETK